MSTARKYHTIEGRFPMEHGGSLVDPVIAFETWGELNFARDNTILLFTGLSPSAHAASSKDDPSTGWWEQMLGPRRPIDTTKYFVVCINSLGSCFGSTGAASTNPETGEPYRLDFPVLTIEDIAISGQQVIKALGIEKLHAVVGASMGGMTAIAHSILFPDVAEGLVSISGAARALPYSIGLRSLQREMIRSDPAWAGGHYPIGEEPVDGMRLARKLGMLTYRSTAEFEQRFGRELVSEERKTGEIFGIDFEVESYLDAHAKKFTGTFDANCYMYLSRAMDLFDVADHGGSVRRGLARAGARRALVIGVETDILFPLKQQRELATGLDRDGREVTFHGLPSLQGHDSFLVDMDRFRPILCDFFNCTMNQPGRLQTVNEG
ncbi:MAG: homoserine O-acetyltransferase [Gammaproteobacteria bacterium]|nr:homoserine O-acetyltransferase [Gammaproteobacteria bacterium]